LLSHQARHFNPSSSYSVWFWFCWLAA